MVGFSGGFGDVGGAVGTVVSDRGVTEGRERGSGGPAPCRRVSGASIRGSSGRRALNVAILLDQCRGVGKPAECREQHVAGTGQVSPGPCRPQRSLLRRWSATAGESPSSVAGVRRVRRPRLSAFGPDRLRWESGDRRRGKGVHHAWRRSDRQDPLRQPEGRGRPGTRLYPPAGWKRSARLQPERPAGIRRPPGSTSRDRSRRSPRPAPHQVRALTLDQVDEVPGPAAAELGQATSQVLAGIGSVSFAAPGFFSGGALHPGPAG